MYPAPPVTSTAMRLPSDRVVREALGGARHPGQGGEVAVHAPRAADPAPPDQRPDRALASGPAAQLHLGALRNNNTRLLKQLGPDTGFDSIGDFPQIQSLAAYLDRLDQEKALPKTIGIRKKGGSTWELKTETNLFTIFTQLAPEMMVEIEATAVA